MSRVSIRPQVRVELLEAAAWYEARSVGLGAAFLAAFDVVLTGIVRYPRGYQVVFDTARRATLRRFPYAVIYALEDEEIVILACVHTSRDPAEWQRRL